MQINTNYGIEGYFRLVVRKANTGNIVKDTGLFKNIITNYGMNFIAGTTGVFNGCTVGSGTTPESVTDVGIQTFVARTNTTAPGGDPTNSVGSTVEPYYSKMTATWRFAQGVAVGNISEVGVIANYVAPNYQLWSRTLIKDSSGNPVTITVLADEILDVYYEARIYLQSTATTGSITILGNSYSYRILSAALTSSIHGRIFSRGFGFRTDNTATVANGPLGPAPDYQTSGSVLGTRNSAAGVAYVNDSYSISCIYTFSPGTATGDMRSFRITMTTLGPLFALELTPAFTKISTVEVKVTHVVTWARRAI